MNRDIRWAAAGAALAVASAACGGGTDAGAGTSAGTDDAPTDRQSEVADRGAEVMPFDLDATSHRFDPTRTGLVQTVVADDPEDGGEIEAVRTHLAAEATRFRQGDYGDPAAIHGEDMPGLADLEAGAAAVEISVTEVRAGARLTFTTDDPDLVDALHHWAEAQTSDHGAHAEQPVTDPG